MLLSSVDQANTKQVKIPPLRKRRSLNISQQKQVLDYIDERKTYGWITGETGLSKSTINGIRNRWEKILRHIRDGKNTRETKKIVEVSHPMVDKAIFYWFLQQRAVKLTITSEMIKAAAMDFHEKMCLIENCPFRASDGWCRKFKKRHNIRSLTVSGERLSSDVAGIAEFKLKVIQLMTEMDLSLEQLYNADETALYYKLLPSKTLVTREEKKAPGTKAAKERMTIMPCCNVTGTNRVQLQIIGKSEKPRCFSRKPIPNDVMYSGSKNAWQTRFSFTKWFKTAFIPSVQNFSLENNISPKAILILDNASSHTEYDRLDTENIKVLYLPPNSTSLIQPMDQSVILPLKIRYRKMLMQRIMLNSCDQSNWITFLKKLDVSDAIHIIRDSWRSIDNRTIINSWKNILDGFKCYDDIVSTYQLDLSADLETLQNCMVELSNETISSENLMQVLTEIDGSNVRHFNNEEIVSLINHENEPYNDDDDQGEDSEVEEGAIESSSQSLVENNYEVSKLEAINSLETVINYLVQESEFEKLIFIEDLKQHILNK